MDAEQKTMIALAAHTRELLKQAMGNLDTLERYIGANGGGKDHAIKDFLKAFDSLWASRHGEPYIFAGAKDAAGAKKLLAALPKDELWTRTKLYIASNDEFYVKNRHPFGMLVKDINKFTARPRGAMPATGRIADCKHTPACASDVEHTRRRAEDMRK